MSIEISSIEIKKLYPEAYAEIYEAGRYHEIYKLRKPEIRAAQAARRQREEAVKLVRAQASTDSFDEPV